MDRPPVSTEQSGVQIQHRVWPCVPHSREVDCTVAQEAYLRSKHALKPARKADNGKSSG